MDNKVLIKLIVPEIDQNYDLYLPINKKIGSIVKLLNQAINDFNQEEIEFKYLYNGKTGASYNYNELLANTDIRNGTKLIIIR
jgi:hypothetical protein